MNGQFASPRPPMAYPQPGSFPNQAAFQQAQPPQQPQPAFDNMSNRYPPGPAGFAPPGPGQPMGPPQQQARRLDPEQMPSAIQVMEDDRKARSGAFPTNQRGTVPPLVTTPFVTQDHGNAGPRFVRSSMYRYHPLQKSIKN